MKYFLPPKRALELIENILSPFEVRNKIDDSWEKKWWKLSNDSPQRQVIVWDKNGETVFTFDRAYNELTISTNHMEKILSYIPLRPTLLKVLLVELFKNLFDKKFPVDRVQNFGLRRHNKEYLEED